MTGVYIALHPTHDLLEGSIDPDKDWQTSVDNPLAADLISAPHNRADEAGRAIPAPLPG